MSLMVKGRSCLGVLEQLDVSSYEESKKPWLEWVWQQPEKISVQGAVEVWLLTLYFLLFFLLEVFRYR